MKKRELRKYSGDMVFADSANSTSSANSASSVSSANSTV